MMFAKAGFGVHKLGQVQCRYRSGPQSEVYRSSAHQTKSNPKGGKGGVKVAGTHSWPISQPQALALEEGGGAGQALGSCHGHCMLPSCFASELPEEVKCSEVISPKGHIQKESSAGLAQIWLCDLAGALGSLPPPHQVCLQDEKRKSLTFMVISGPEESTSPSA